MPEPSEATWFTAPWLRRPPAVTRAKTPPPLQPTPRTPLCPPAAPPNANIAESPRIPPRRRLQLRGVKPCDRDTAQDLRADVGARGCADDHVRRPQVNPCFDQTGEHADLPRRACDPAPAQDKG